jgi:hypothetical protein
LQDRHVRAVAVHACPNDNLRDRRVERVGHVDGGGLRLAQPRRQRALLCRPALRERVGVVGECLAPPDHLGALLGIDERVHHHPQPDAVGQLRPQVALLRVHRADE